MKSVALVGRPNVGKSTIFNALIKKRSSITHNVQGTTRDRVTELITGFDFEILLHDLAGYDSQIVYKKEIEFQLREAIDLSDLVLFVVAAPEPIAEDFEFVELLRAHNKQCLLVVNKVDLLSDPEHVHEFYRLGLSTLVGISAEHRYNLDELMQVMEQKLAAIKIEDKELQTDLNPDSHGTFSAIYNDAANIPIALLGKPNSGKSSLFNLLLNKERSIVSDLAGTTRDMIKDGFEHHGNRFLIIDTPGLRRKKNVIDTLEHHSSMRSIEAIRLSLVVILVVDASLGISHQDRVLLSLCARAGKPTVLFYNKWDLLDQHARDQTGSDSAIMRRLGSLTHSVLIRGCAFESESKEDLVRSVMEIHRQTQFTITTHELNETIQRIYENNPPPIIQRRRGKISYVFRKSSIPLHFVFRVNNPKLFSESYRRYITNSLRKVFKLPHIPILVTIEKKAK